MPLADGGGGGGINNIRKPRTPSIPPSNKFESLLNPVSAPSSTPQRVYNPSPSPIKPKPEPYSVNNTAWGPDYFKNSNQLRNTLTQLQRSVDPEALNGFLSNLMTDRYEAFQDRLANQYDRQSTRYETRVEQMLDQARAGQPFTIPKKPTLEAPGPGQGVNAMLKAFANQVKQARSQGEKEAITKFYDYELERLIGNSYEDGFIDDVREQRTDLRGTRRDAMA